MVSTSGLKEDTKQENACEVLSTMKEKQCLENYC